MAESTLLSIAFFLICVLFILLLIAFTKLNTMQKRLTDVSPKDLYPFLEELRELVIESERIADKLEDNIKKKEELLEDITSLAEDKLKRLETIDDRQLPLNTHSYGYQRPVQQTAQPIQDVRQSAQMSIRDRISDLIAIGMTDTQIATELGISTTEVQIIRKLEN